MDSLRRVALSVIAVGFLSVQAHAATPVTQCGQVVKGSAELVGDLDCSAMQSGAAVNLSGTLHLRGFRITGMRRGIGVACNSPSCRIVGPGTITGPDDVIYGVMGLESRQIVLKNVTIDGVKGYGAFSMGNVLATGSTITGCGGFLAAEGGNSGGGVMSHAKVRVVRSTISGNSNMGVIGTSVRASRSSNNGTAPDCATTCSNCPCADIISSTLPVVRKSTCDTSAQPSGATWGVCAGD
jgi:hypothetical protein